MTLPTAMDSWLVSRATVRQVRSLQRATTVAAASALDLASNDYLGLSTHPQVTDAACHATRTWGAGARASRVVTGTHPVHEELEDQLCQLTGAETALVFSSGYTANLGHITALSGPGTLLITDEHIHASMIDAVRQTRSPRASFAQNDITELETLLAQRAQPRAVVAVESIYSVLGDAAPLTQLAELCRTHDALLIVDEAHGIGVAGRGTGLAPAAAAAAAQATRIIRTEPQRVDCINQHRHRLATLLNIEPAAGAVQSVRAPSSVHAQQAAAELADHGILVGCFRPPSVPDGISRLRITARADLTEADIDRAGTLIHSTLNTTAVPAESAR